jgi:hypothetical protein
MEGLDETPLPAYLIGFPAGMQQTVRYLVERAKADYQKDVENFKKDGKEHPVREEVYGEWIQVHVSRLRKSVLEHNIEKINAPTLFLATYCAELFNPVVEE